LLRSRQRFDRKSEGLDKVAAGVVRQSFGRSKLEAGFGEVANTGALGACSIDGDYMEEVAETVEDISFGEAFQGVEHNCSFKEEA
jgi:hypothetical protein